MKLRTILFPLAALTVVMACRINTTPPEEAAQKFVDDLNIKIQGRPNCTGVDTDNDGYVSCTVMLAQEDHHGNSTMSLQCADTTSYFGCDGHTTRYAMGCKETRPANVIRVQDQ